MKGRDWCTFNGINVMRVCLTTNFCNISRDLVSRDVSCMAMAEPALPYRYTCICHLGFISVLLSV